MQNKVQISRRGFLAVSSSTAIGLAMGGRSAVAGGLTLSTGDPATPANRLTDEEVGQAIERYKKAIWDNRRPDGSFDLNARYVSTHGDHGQAIHGGTVLAALALVVTGESIQNEELAPTIRLLEQYEPTNMYELSLSGHLWSYLPGRFRPLLGQAADRLLASQARQGVWDTYEPVKKAGDPLDDPAGYLGRNCLSVTQYGVLGLWQARKRGYRVPYSFWEQTAEAWLERQREDGSFHYSDQTAANAQKSTQKMTCAGVTILLVCQQELCREQDRPNTVLQRAIAKALEWLDNNFSMEIDGWMADLHGYQYYGYERVALACGRTSFGSACPDWYRKIGRHLVDQGPSHNIVNDAFNLMFLARGRVPVWCNKLSVPGTHAWNNRPNDIYFANDFLSDAREHEMCWALADIDSAPERWMTAPLTFLSTDEPITFTDAQLDNLRRYTALGGTLLINPENRRARQWAHELCETLFPQHPLERPGEGHFLYDGMDTRAARRRLLQTVSNGARELVIVFDEDLGLKYQAEDRPSLDDDHWRLLFNLFCLTTDRGKPRNRLASPFTSYEPKQPAQTVRVGLGVLSPDGPIEPACYLLANTILTQRHGIGIEAAEVALDALATEAAPQLLHLAGVDAVELTGPQLDQLDQYIRAGGTVLIETIGGRGDFSAVLSRQIAGRLSQSPQRVSAGPLLRGSGTLGTRVGRAVYRQYTTELVGGEARANLNAIELDNRPAVIVSDQDLTLGLMQSTYFCTNGYAPDTAIDLFANMLAMVATG
ncbi:MAG: DUF4159 domain-containing protein [Phycisphaerales bacterium JB063]